MADWLAPFHLPKFSDEKFDKQRDAYVKKNGYTITVPAFNDIVKWKRFTPLTEKETKLWTGKIPVSEMPRVPMTGEEIAALLQAGKHRVATDRTMNAEEQKAYRADAKNSIPPERLEEIREEKETKRAKFQAMLKSPSPKIASAAGAILTSLDDTQDALSTLACIGMIAAVVVGGTTAAMLAGPVGLLAGAAALLNMLNPMSRLKGFTGKAKTGRAAKKDLEKFSDKNPFSKTAKGKMLKKMAKFRPSLSNAIEAAQVTAGIFGIGLSIGPIMGFAQDLIFGTVRTLAGQDVSFKSHPPKVPQYVATAQRAAKAQSVLHGFAWQSDMSDEISSLIAANLALQAVEPYLQEWNPIDQVDDLANVEIAAPRPIDVLTLEIIEESGKTLDEVCNWPQTGERWISLGDLQDQTAKQATENLTHFAQVNKNSVEAFIALQNAHDFALGTIEAIEGPGHVEIQYSHIERIVIIILDNGWCYPDDITDAQVAKFEDWCYVHEYMNTQPSSKDIWRYAEVFCGFKWAKSPDEIR